MPSSPPHRVSPAPHARTRGGGPVCVCVCVCVGGVSSEDRGPGRHVGTLFKGRVCEFMDINKIQLHRVRYAPLCACCYIIVTHSTLPLQLPGSGRVRQAPEARSPCARNRHELCIITRTILCSRLLSRRLRAPVAENQLLHSVRPLLLPPCPGRLEVANSHSQHAPRPTGPTGKHSWSARRSRSPCRISVRCPPVFPLFHHPTRRRAKAHQRARLLGSGSMDGR